MRRAKWLKRIDPQSRQCLCEHYRECGCMAQCVLVDVDERRRHDKRREIPLCREHAEWYAERYRLKSSCL